jgi:hypothetical protein
MKQIPANPGERDFTPDQKCRFERFRHDAARDHRPVKGRPRL